MPCPVHAGETDVTGLPSSSIVPVSAGCDTKQSQADVGAAGADQTGEPEHLTPAQLEGDV